MKSSEFCSSDAVCVSAQLHPSEQRSLRKINILIMQHPNGASRPWYKGLLLLLLMTQATMAQEIGVMTYNIKYDNVQDTVNNWNDRKAAMVDLLQKEHPDFIGMQEVLYRQLEYLDQALDGYDYVGVGRDDGKQKGEFSPIFYDTQRYQLLASNTFWLSKTPDKISVGWDAAMERICSFGLFVDKNTEKKVYVFNTHFDHIGVKARANSAKLILKKIASLNRNKLPVILMGDLNLEPDAPPIRHITQHLADGAVLSSARPTGPKGTFNGFNTQASIERRIDYIFLSGFQVAEYEHLNERLDNGKHISDHLPVFARIIPLNGTLSQDPR